MTLTFFTALMAAQAVQTTPQSAADEPIDHEIVVTRERLRRIRISPGVKIRDGVVTPGTCKVKRSSGDAAIDALACDAVALCSTRPTPSRSLFNTCVMGEAETSIRTLLAERRARSNGMEGSQ